MKFSVLTPVTSLRRVGYGQAEPAGAATPQVPGEANLLVVFQHLYL